MQQNRLVHIQQAMKFRVWSGVDHSGVILAKTVAVNIIHLRSDPEGNSFFSWESCSDVSRDKIEGNIRTRGKTKLTGFPRDQTSSDLLYF